MKVLGIGESVIDKAQLSKNDGTTRHVGGPAPIGLMFLSRLGIDCTLVTTLGEDSNAKIIEQALQKEQVKILAKRQPKTKVNTYLIGEDGSRKKIRGGVVHNHIENLDQDFVQQFDWILIDRHEKKAFYEILAKKKPSAKIIIDPSTEISQFTLDMIHYADYPILPIEALKKVDPKKDLAVCLEKLYQLSQKPLIITAGNLGSIIYDGTMLETIPALKVHAVDVQGAGDIYRGAFAYGMIRGWNTIKSATYATLAAGIQCTKVGNASAIPTKKEIDAYQQQLVREKLQKIDESFFANIKHYE